ncbi:MAG: ArsR family transcriptional regulator [Candidatus Thermoplasmatota archaeon]|nr:ArsR family transcriptional regulator [Candidatus Thermoplasmatota archaeon]
MKGRKPHRLTAKDDKIINIFTELGMPKNLAKTLLYISQVDECRSSEIEQGAKLRQPEVSVAMQELKKRGWIDKRDLKKEGKGRPIYIYKLTSSMENIVKSYEKEKLEEIEIIRKDINELKNLLEDR